MKNRILFFLCLLCAAPVMLLARTYYVSTAGNNNNSGLTAALPWQSIAKVNASFGIITAGDTISFRRGDIFFGTLIIGQSGTSIKPIVINAYGSGVKPVITGSVALSTWSYVANGIYQAPAAFAKSSLNLVTIDNTPRALGRFPNADDVNGGYLNYESFTGTTSITDNDLTAATSLNWTGAEVVIRKKLWVLDRCLVTAQNGNVISYANPTTYDGVNGYGYFFQNDPRTLDQFGEWYFNNSTKNLQVYFGDNMPASFSVKASALDTLLFMNAKSYININNIAFEGANADAMLILNGGNINIQSCDFTNAGDGAISASNVTNLLIENCTTNNILSNSIQVSNGRANNTIIRGCSIKNTAVLPGMGASNGGSYKGIVAVVSKGLLVEYNRVDTTGYVGIEFQGSDVVIKNNVVNYFDFVKDDAGGIYTYVSGTDAEPGPTYTNRVIRDNIVMNGAGAPYGRNSSNLFVSGIYLDGRTMNVDVLNNTVFNNGKNGIHSNNPTNVRIEGNTSFNNLNALSIMRWSWGSISGLKVKRNILYPKTENQRLLYYTNSGLNEPDSTTLQATLKQLGAIDSNYYNPINATGHNLEIYPATGASLLPTSPLSVDGWRLLTSHDSSARNPAKLPVSYKLNSLVGSNKFSNGLFSTSITGITLFGTNVTAVWDNTGRISGGALKLSFTNPVPNKYALLHSPVGAISAAKKYLFRFSTYGTTAFGIARVYIRKTTSPYNNLTPVQVKSFGAGRKDHEFLFTTPVTDAGGSFVIEIEQNSGTTYLDNIEFYEAEATVYDVLSQLRFEYNDTRTARTIALGSVYTGVDGTVYNNSITLQPYTSAILVRDTGITPLTATASASVIKCYGDTATVTVSAAGGVTPYQGTGTFRVLAGTYTFTVSDAAGNTRQVSVTVTQPSPLTVTLSAGTIALAGGSTTLTVAASGGKPPYTGTGAFSLTAGTYTRTVTDSNGCTASATLTIADGLLSYSLTAATSPAAGGIITGSGSYIAGTMATLTATPAAGYTFSGWSGAVTGTTNPITVLMTGNKSVTANFTVITYSLATTASPATGGTITGGGSYASGATATLTATPAAGYAFSGWSGAVTGTTNPVTVSMTANKAVTASFIPVTYSLTATASPASGGTITGAGTYISGATATLTATPAAGYTFSGWSGAVTGTAATVTVSMTANKTVTATFTPVASNYTLTTTASPTAGGTITGGGSYASGATATLTATPAAGYIFSGWSGAVTGTTNPITVSMTANKSVTATFTAISYSLTTTASPTAGGTITGGGSYASGATATLTATPAAGYTFSGWSGAVTGITNPITVSMTANKSVTATFTQITYSLTTTASPTAGGTITGGGSYASGATATLTATPAAGYTFSGWSGAVTGTTNPITVSMTANKSVTATFTQITYSLTTTASPTAGGTITGGGSYASGATATLTATPAAGYTFSGWSGAVTGTTNPITVSMTANKSVTATFTAITYSLTTTASPTAGGTITGDGSYASGATATLTATPAAGYTFSGWSGAVTGTTNPITVSMTANKSVTATFTAITYSLTTTASPAAGGTITGGGSYASGATATLTATPAAGYIFSGWSGAVTGTTNPITVSMTANKSVTATFTQITYSLTTTASPTAGGTITGGGSYASGATATLTATPAAGYIFSGWSGAVTGTTNPITVSMTANKSVTATFTQITYSLTTTASPTAGGTITGGGSYASGATATLTATPAAGYTFSGWSGAVTGTTNPITVSMTANKSVTATFTAITYSLTTTANPTAGGTITGGGSYASGATATLTATPAAGYTFSGWSGAVTGTTNPITVSMTANKSVTATFTQITYSLTTTASPTAGGSITGGGSYASGATATLTATPAAGYTFSGWSGAVTGTTNPITVSMTANKSVTATFTAITYSLTTTASPTAGGTITGGGSYASGATATLTATPAAGYTFSGWSGAVTGTTNPITVSMTANKSVTATFTQITYSLTTTASPTAGGTITGGGSYASGATATLTATPAAGYTFSGWSGAVTGTTNPITVSMTANKSVTATFTAITYSLTTTASPTAGGTITGGGSYASGATATLTATPAAGYTFSGWSGAVTGTTNPITVSMTANKSVTATFTAITYSLTTTASPTAGGTITGGGSYASGATATLTATPVAGYAFSGWSGAVTGTTNPITVSMTANKSVTATFTAITYSLTTTASPTAGGSITGGGTYTYGATAVLTATAAPGYTFTGWGGDAAGTNNAVSVIINSNKNVTALFVANTTLRIEDDSIGINGLCSIQGTVSNNSGATNRKSINLTNSLAKGLNWSVGAGAAGTYNLRWRYANGSTTNTEYMKLIINGIVVKDSVPFPRTAGSSSFVTTNGDFPLLAGVNSIRLESIEARATADIDWMEVTGYNPSIASCETGGARIAAAPATENTARPVAEGALSGVYPNPSNGKINIAFPLPETQKVWMSVLDAAGYTVAQLPPQLLRAGSNTLTYNMAGKTPGVYMVIIRGEKNIKQAYKFIVIQ